MKEIGIILGVLQSRVSQIHASAVLHLRARLTDPANRREATNKPRARSPVGDVAKGSRLLPGASDHFRDRP
jgi:RNA polymerase sigma factor FliA